MKIKMTSVYVDDQDKALRFYTEVLGFVKKADFRQGPFRWLTVVSPGGAGRHGAPARAERQALREGVPGRVVRLEPTRRHVLHGRRERRIRAHEDARCRVRDAADGRDRIEDRAGERHVRESRSARPADAVVAARARSSNQLAALERSLATSLWVAA